MLNYETKVANGGATAAGRLSHGEDNVRFSELKNAVSATGIPLDELSASDNKMLAQAQCRSASGGVNLEDIGSPNAYVLQSPGGFVLPKAYFDGMQISFYPANSNTGQSSINVNSIGSVDLRRNDGSHVQTGDVIHDRPVTARYSSIVGYFRILPWTLASFSTGGGVSNPGLVTEGYPFSMEASAMFSSSGSATIIKESGINGLTDLGVGKYRLTFDSTQPDTNYHVSVTSIPVAYVMPGLYEARAVELTTNSFEIHTGYHDLGFDFYHDQALVSFFVFRS